MILDEKLFLVGSMSIETLFLLILTPHLLLGLTLLLFHPICSGEIQYGSLLNICWMVSLYFSSHLSSLAETGNNDQNVARSDDIKKMINFFFKEKFEDKVFWVIKGFY